MGEFSPIHWLVFLVVFGIPGFLILRILWRLGSKKQ
jgi:hypothetical protein